MRMMRMMMRVSVVGRRERMQRVMSNVTVMQCVVRVRCVMMMTMYPLMLVTVVRVGVGVDAMMRQAVVRLRVCAATQHVECQC